jgi:hypothetical protein
MKASRDEMLLRRFRLCRADIVATIAESSLPPSPQSLRHLADLQLSIMAVEAAIQDKADATFKGEFLMEAAA